MELIELRKSWRKVLTNKKTLQIKLAQLPSKEEVRMHSHTTLMLRKLQAKEQKMRQSPSSKGRYRM